MKKTVLFLCGLLVGALNVLLGAGAGVTAVLLFKKQGLEQKQAQANALAVMLPTSLISLIIYFLNGYVNFYDNIFLLPTAAVGAVLGTLLLKKITPKYAKILLGAFSVFAGIRLILKQ